MVLKPIIGLVVAMSAYMHLIAHCVFFSMPRVTTKVRGQLQTRTHDDNDIESKHSLDNFYSYSLQKYGMKI